MSNPYLPWRLNKGRADWDQTHVFTGTMNARSARARAGVS